VNTGHWQRIRGLGKWRIAVVLTKATPAQARSAALGRYPVHAPKPDPKGAGAWLQQTRFGKSPAAVAKARMQAQQLPTSTFGAKPNAQGSISRAIATSGNGWLRAVLGEVAWALSHTSDNYLSAQFHRLARRGGQTKSRAGGGAQCPGDSLPPAARPPALLGSGR
jgi:hypothetical protein